MYPSQLRELHPSVDYEWTCKVVAASLWEAPHQLLLPWIGVAHRATATVCR